METQSMKQVALILWADMDDDDGERRRRAQNFFFWRAMKTHLSYNTDLFQ